MNKIVPSLICFVFIAISSQLFSADEIDRSKEFSFFKGEKTSIKNPFELRDPFKKETLKLSSGMRKVDQDGFAGSYSNLPDVNNTTLDQIKIVGVLLGTERRALAQIGANPSVVVLKEGMKLGVDNIELKAIFPGGVVLVEKIKNVYDQDEFLETIIPVTSNSESGPTAQSAVENR